MAKLTLLEIVVSILNDMDSDEINSISDTVESTQVASIVKDTYYQIITRLDQIPEHKSLITLTALSNSSYPNYLRLPTNVFTIDWVKYDESLDSTKKYRTIKWVDPKEFIDRILSRDSSSSYITTVTDLGGVPLLIQNNKMPDFYTSFDDLNLVFDSYDSAIESSMQSSRSLAFASLEPAWTVTDTFIPELDSNLFPLLLAESKAACFASLRQAANPSVERSAKRQLTSTQNKKHRFGAACDGRPDYGR